MTEDPRPSACASAVVRGSQGDTSAFDSPSTSVSVYMAGAHQRTVLTLHLRQLGVPPPPPPPPGVAPPPPLNCYSYDCERHRANPYPNTAHDFTCRCGGATWISGVRAMSDWIKCRSKRRSDGSIEVDLVDYRNFTCSFGQHVLVTSVSCLPRSYHPPPGPPNSGTCYNSCRFGSDGDCDDGGIGAAYSACDACHDCQDCGSRAYCPLDTFSPSPRRLHLHSSKGRECLRRRAHDFSCELSLTGGGKHA
jgi:hypothetical protein